MPTYCCVPQCSSNAKNDKGVKFHLLPSDGKRRKEWEIKIRTGKRCSKWARVCSKHFRNEDYTVTSMGQWKILKSNAVPSCNLPTRSHESRKPRTRPERKTNDVKETTQYPQQHPLEVILANDCCTYEEVVSTDTDMQDEACVSFPNSSSTVNSGDNNKNSTSSRGTQTWSGITFVSCDRLSEDEFKYLSGYTRKRFSVLYDFITSHENVRHFSITFYDALLLTLIKYRHNLDYKMLAILFKIDRNLCSTIFEYVTVLIYQKLKCIDFWKLGKPHHDEKSYTAIIDCTEMLIQRPTNLEQQQSCFSHYKNRHTFKVLVAINEQGLVTYVSDCFAGSISDRAIVNECGFLDLLTEGDIILADKGFDISDILEQRKVALNLPPFKTAAQLSEKQVAKTRAIASRRIHVERLIGLGKQDAILSQVITSDLWPIATCIVYNSMMLCNFKKPLIQQ